MYLNLIQVMYLKLALQLSYNLFDILLFEGYLIF